MFSILRIGKGTARGYGILGLWKYWVGIIGQRSVAKSSVSGESSYVQGLPRFWSCLLYGLPGWELLLRLVLPASVG